MLILPNVKCIIRAANVIIGIVYTVSVVPIKFVLQSELEELLGMGSVT